MNPNIIVKYKNSPTYNAIYHTVTNATKARNPTSPNVILYVYYGEILYRQWAIYFWKRALTAFIFVLNKRFFITAVCTGDAFFSCMFMFKSNHVSESEQWNNNTATGPQEDRFFSWFLRLTVFWLWIFESINFGWLAASMSQNANYSTVISLLLYSAPLLTVSLIKNSC